MSSEFYVSHRTGIVAVCRLASSLLPRLASQPAATATAAFDWRQFLLLSGALGVNTVPWMARLPFKVGALLNAAAQKT